MKWTQRITMLSPGEAAHQDSGVGGFWGTVPVESNAPPSTYAVAAVVNGEPGAAIRLFGVTMLRAGFIIPGIWLSAKIVGAKDVKGWRMLAMSMAASSSISTGLLLWYWIQSKLSPDSAAPSLEGR